MRSIRQDLPDRTHPLAASVLKKKCSNAEIRAPEFGVGTPTRARVGSEEVWHRLRLLMAKLVIAVEPQFVAIRHGVFDRPPLPPPSPPAAAAAAGAGTTGD